jgi:predicted ATPase
MARLDRYMPVKEIAQIGAAIGREFSYELISAVAPRTKAELEDGLERLTASGLAFRRGTPPEATYTFKHALVQDAAYDSLLKSRRQELHGKIARVIEERFPNIKITEPEVLAHHHTQAGQLQQAVPLWEEAGQLALKRMALTEAISHLNRGLELVSSLPQSRERDVAELGLQTLLGTAWVALKGWAAPEVWTSASRALPLAKSLARSRELFPLYWWIQANVMCQGRVAESLEWAKEMLATAKSTGDPDLLVTGHAIMVNAYFWLGRLVDCQAHANEVFTLYDEEKHRHLADIVNHDPKTVAGVYAAQATWMLGYPDRARELSDVRDEQTRRRGHPFDLCWALTFGSGVFDFRCEPAEHRKRFEEADRLAREQSLPFMFACMVPMQNGIALIRQGSLSEGMASINAAGSIWQASGGQVYSPYTNAVLAEAMARSGDLEGALQTVDEQLEQIERSGWEERIHYAEILRLKGWMLSLKSDFEGAQASYLASLDWAREQQAKSWELRTATSLAKLWQSQGKRKEALELLRPIYDWFTEGFDTRDLKEAKALLGELAA